MSSQHIETRRKLQEIPKISRFDELLAMSTISEEDKQILRMHYLECKDFKYIGDILGYAEVTIKKRHIKALKKLSCLF